MWAGPVASKTLACDVTCPLLVVVEWIVIELLPVILQCSFLEAD
jgi:hypothetical protein